MLKLLSLVHTFSSFSMYLSSTLVSMFPISWRQLKTTVWSKWSEFLWWFVFLVVQLSNTLSWMTYSQWTSILENNLNVAQEARIFVNLVFIFTLFMCNYCAYIYKSRSKLIYRLWTMISFLILSLALAMYVFMLSISILWYSNLL